MLEKDFLIIFLYLKNMREKITDVKKVILQAELEANSLEETIQKLLINTKKNMKKQQRSRNR